jgi:hypothetical protein
MFTRSHLTFSLFDTLTDFPPNTTYTTQFCKIHIKEWTVCDEYLMTQDIVFYLVFFINVIFF